MPISDRSYERLDRGIRLGLSLWAESDKEKRLGEERKKVRAEERKYRESQERRQKKAFEWKTEDRQKKKNYDVLKGELRLGDALIDAGNIREGAARYVNAYNKKWPDRKKAILSFRSDKPDAKSTAEWDSRPGLAGNEIALALETGELVAFKSIEEFKKFAKSVMSPNEYLKASKASESAVAEMNAQEKPFRTNEGPYINTWVMGPDGNPVRGPAVPYKEKMPITEAERMGLKIKATEKAIGEPLTTAEVKQVRLGIKPTKKEKAVAPGKQRDKFKKDLDLIMRPFHKEESLYDELGDLTKEGKSAFNVVLSLIEKARKDYKSLTTQEKANLKHARRASEMFDKISETISAEYEREPESGSNWQQYRRTPAAGSSQARTKLPPGEEKKFQEWYSYWADYASLDPNPDDPRHKYDYRAAYQQGVEPEIDPRDGQYHWPSTYKDLDHPNRFVNGVDTISGGVPTPYQQPRQGISPIPRSYR